MRKKFLALILAMVTSLCGFFTVCSFNLKDLGASTVKEYELSVTKRIYNQQDEERKQLSFNFKVDGAVGDVSELTFSSSNESVVTVNNEWENSKVDMGIRTALSNLSDSKIVYNPFTITSNNQGAEYHPNATAQAEWGLALANYINSIIN